VFYTLWGDISVTKLLPQEFPHWAFALRWTHSGANSMWQSWFRGSARGKLLCCVLYGLRQYQCKKVDSAGAPASSLCIMCFTLCGATSATKVLPGEESYSAFVSRVTCFEKISVWQSWSHGSACIKLVYCIKLLTTLHTLSTCVLRNPYYNDYEVLEEPLKPPAHLKYYATITCLNECGALEEPREPFAHSKYYAIMLFFENARPWRNHANM